MNKKTLLSLAGIVLAVGAALYNWKYGTGDDTSTTGAANSSGGTATQEPRSGGSSAESTFKAPTQPAPPKPAESTPPKSSEKRPSSTEAKTGSAPTGASNVGFGSTRSFDEHYDKHGAEFGSITQAEYLAMAQKLRDAPVGGSILEAVRDDGVISRFDKKSGAFLAFNKNKTIRTFFKPNDGVRYFERQIDKDH